jgi:hypothetical protein
MVRACSSGETHAPRYHCSRSRAMRIEVPGKGRSCSCWPARHEARGRPHLISSHPSPSPPFLSRPAALSTLSHHLNFYRYSDPPWATKGATLMKRSLCHPSPLELAPPIVPLLYFSRLPSRSWWVAAEVANGNISQMVNGQKTVLLPARRCHEPQGTQPPGSCCLGMYPPCIRQ